MINIYGRRSGKTITYFRHLIERMINGEVPVSLELKRVFEENNNDVEVILGKLMQAINKYRECERMGKTVTTHGIIYDEWLLEEFKEEK